MGDIAVRVGQWPLGEGVGGEALVYQRERGYTLGVLQVQEVFAHLRGKQQAFVHNRAAAHRRHVVFFTVLEAQILYRSAGSFANHVQFAL